MPAGRVVLKAALAVGVFLLAVSVRLPYCTDFPLGADAADYLTAARQGFWSTYVGSNTATLPSVLHRYITDPDFHDHPWALLAQEGDQQAYRHFHVPLALYPSAIALDWTSSNRIHRILPALTAALCAPLVLLGCWWCGMRTTTALLGASLVAVDHRFTIASTNLTPHPLYILLALAFLFCASRYLGRPTKAGLLVSVAILAAACATLELAPSLVVAACAGAVWSAAEWRDALKRPAEWRQTLYTFSVVLFIAWPAGLWGLGYGTSYLFYVALSAFHRQDYFGSAGAYDLYSRLFGHNVLLAVSAFSAIIGSVAFWRLRIRSALLSVVGSYVAIAAVLNYLSRFRNQTYSAETTVFVWVLFAVVVDLLWTEGQKRRTLPIPQLLALVGYGAVVAEVAFFL